MKIAWRVLVGLGSLLALIAIGMDTTAPGTRIVNLSLMARQQTFLILGSALLLGGLVLFGFTKIKQTKEEEEEEERAARERVQKVTDTLASWKRRGDERVATLEARRERDPDRRPIQRLLAGIFVGLTCFFVGVGMSGSFAFGGLLLVIPIVYSFWRGNSQAVIRRLMLGNVVVATVLYLYGVLRSGMTLKALLATSQFVPATIVLFLVPMAISAFVLLKRRGRPEQPRETSGD